MRFHEKLDLLMDLTRTTNRDLGRFLMVDPSQVSRLRNGRRRPSRGMGTMLELGRFFAGRIREDYQRSALERAMGQSKPLPTDVTRLAVIIAECLEQDDVGEDLWAQLPASPCGSPSESDDDHADVISARAYYGVSGKHQAVNDFMEQALQQDTPITICLFNNDDMVWLLEDTLFSRRVNQLNVEMFKKGHTMKVVFTSERNFKQIRAMVESWMPLLLSRSIEVFYYAGQSDWLLRRHLAVIPDELALCSNSVGDMDEAKLTLLLADRKAVAALHAEFNQLVRMSKPLFNIYRSTEETRMLADLAAISRQETRTIRYSDPISINSVPPDIFASMFQRMDYGQKDRAARYYEEIHRFHEWNIRRVQTVDIIQLPPVDDVIAQKAPVDISLYFPMDTVFYTPEEMAGHIRHLLRLMERNEQYFVVLHTGFPDRHLMLVKEGSEVLVTQKKFPPVIMNTREPIIVELMKDYLLERAGVDALTPVGRHRTIKALEAYVSKLV